MSTHTRVSQLINLNYSRNSRTISWSLPLHFSSSLIFLKTLVPWYIFERTPFLRFTLSLYFWQYEDSPKSSFHIFLLLFQNYLDHVSLELLNRSSQSPIVLNRSHLKPASTSHESWLNKINVPNCLKYNYLLLQGCFTRSNTNFIIRCNYLYSFCFVCICHSCLYFSTCVLWYM